MTNWINVPQRKEQERKSLSEREREVENGAA